MNTFKKGDKINHRYGEATVSYISGPYVYIVGGGSYHHLDCTLVPQPKFRPGDVVKYSGKEYTIKGPKKMGWSDEIAYEFTSQSYGCNDWNPERGLTLVRRANEPQTLGDILNTALKTVTIESLLKAGKKIEAIKEYRVQHGVGLKEAMDAVKAIEAGFTAAVAAPKFKVGDRVEIGFDRDSPYSHCIGTITDLRIGGIEILLEDSYYASWFDTKYVRHVAKSIPHIVIRKDPGKGLRPNDNPRVHPSLAEATKEAERLALANPGVEFLTFSQGSVSVATPAVVKTVAA